MNKHRIYTVVGVVFSFVIAFCGWMLINALLDRQESMLLAASGSFNDQTTSDPNGEGNNTGSSAIAGSKPVTTEEKLGFETIAKILDNWNNQGKYVRPHEPVKGQLNMKQAITAAKEGLFYLSQKGMIPPELIEELNRTNASLCENQPAIMDNNSYISTELPPEYSYWNISFSNTKANIGMTLNAATGKIWKIDVTSFLKNVSFNNLDLKETIEIYQEYIGLKGGDSLNSSETWATKGFNGSTISIVALKKNLMSVSDKKNQKEQTNAQIYNGINLSLIQSNNTASTEKSIKINK